MKAVCLKEFGNIDQMYIAEVPTPQLSSGEVLIKVEAAALNRADILQRRGLYPPPDGTSDILGLEVAGTVVDASDDVLGWKGVRVMALLSGGGYAEYVAVHATLILEVPGNLNIYQAAGIMEAFLTGWQALKWLGNLQKNEKVLIHAGASGVGSASIQLAKVLGAGILVTSSKSKQEFCRALGADHCIDYTQQEFSEVIKDLFPSGVNLIIDFIGGSYFHSNLKTLSLDGTLVMLGFLGGMKPEDLSLLPILSKRLTIKGSTLRSRRLSYRGKLVEDFKAQCLDLLDTGSLKPIIDKVFPWENVQEAHTYMEENKNQGKVILSIG